LKLAKPSYGATASSTSNPLSHNDGDGGWPHVHRDGVLMVNRINLALQ